MIIDPQIAIIRSSVPLDFIDRIAERILARGEQPRGLLLQCSVATSNGVIVVTVYRDKETQLEGFNSFVAVEAQNEMLSSGKTYDISRQEFELQRLYIDPDIEARPLAVRTDSAVAAATTELSAFTGDDYRNLMQAVNWLDRPAPGRIAHLAWAQGEQMFATDFWTTRELGERWYASLRLPELAEKHPEVGSAGPPRSWWRELHSFDVVAEQGSAMRDFTRFAHGPSENAA